MALLVVLFVLADGRRMGDGTDLLFKVPCDMKQLADPAMQVFKTEPLALLRGCRGDWAGHRRRPGFERIARGQLSASAIRTEKNKVGYTAVIISAFGV